MYLIIIHVLLHNRNIMQACTVRAVVTIIPLTAGTCVHRRVCPLHNPRCQFLVSCTRARVTQVHLGKNFGRYKIKITPFSGRRPSERTNERQTHSENAGDKFLGTFFDGAVLHLISPNAKPTLTSRSCLNSL